MKSKIISALVMICASIVAMPAVAVFSNDNPLHSALGIGYVALLALVSKKTARGRRCMNAFNKAVKNMNME